MVLLKLLKRAVRDKPSRLAVNEYKYGFLFITPMLIGYIVFLIIPLVATFGLSLTDYSLLRGANFVGLDNFKTMFTEDPTFISTMFNTFYFSVLFVPGSLLLSLGLALMLNKSIRGVGIFRTIVFTPYVTTIAVWGIVWKFVFQSDNGAINLILRLLFNVDGPMWLYNESLAIPIVVITTVLKSIGMNMIIFLTALKSVPVMYYEAAELDGAKGLRKFWNVTLPIISPTLFLNVIMSIINSLKVFGIIKTMTEGGPGKSSYVFVYYIYQTAFKNLKFGYASAISVFLFAMIMLLTVIQWRMRKRWVFYEN